MIKLPLGNETDNSKREAFIIKEEVTPELGVSLMDSLCTKVNGDYVMFLLPGLLIKYSITYNQFIEIVKLTESKQFFLFIHYFSYNKPRDS
jgi:hypothetical protein